jgi:hypothetical protein
MISPSHAQLSAALTAARKAIQDQSAFYSNMVSDEVLIPVVNQALIAALNVKETK